MINCYKRKSTLTLPAALVLLLLISAVSAVPAAEMNPVDMVKLDQVWLKSDTPYFGRCRR